MRLLGVVLAGGKSTRFGSDKAFAEIENRPLIAHVLDSLSLCDATLVVGRTSLELIAQNQPPCIPDAEGFEGPVAGLVAALGWADQNSYSHVFLTSCDLLGLAPEWPRELASEARPAAAVKNLVWQSMCSAWEVAALKEYRPSSNSSIWKALDELGATAVDPPEGWANVQGVNTPEDLIRARKRLRAQQS